MGARVRSLWNVQSETCFWGVELEWASVEDFEGELSIDYIELFEVVEGFDYIVFVNKEERLT